MRLSNAARGAWLLSGRDGLKPRQSGPGFWLFIFKQGCYKIMKELKQSKFKCKIDENNVNQEIC